MRRGEIFSAPCIWANSEFLEVPLTAPQSYSNANDANHNMTTPIFIIES